jgi:hypothetical protein
MLGGLAAAALAAGPALAGSHDAASSQPPAHANRQTVQTTHSGGAIKPYVSHPIQPTSSRQPTVYTSQGVQPYASHQVQPYTAHQVQPYTSHEVKPYSSHEVRPYTSHEVQPYSSHEVRPYTSHEVQPYSSHEVQPYDSHPVRLDSGRGAYWRGRGGRGGGAGSFLGAWDTRVGGGTWTGPSDRWGYATQHTSAGAMSGRLLIRPDHTFVWYSTGCPRSAGWAETGDPGKPIALRCFDHGEQKIWYVEADDRTGNINIFDQWGVYYVGRR